MLFNPTFLGLEVCGISSLPVLLLEEAGSSIGSDTIRNLVHSDNISNGGEVGNLLDDIDNLEYADDTSISQLEIEVEDLDQPERGIVF